MLAVDLFCGAGGASLGLERAGIRVKLAVDSWDKAIEAHRRIANPDRVKISTVLNAGIPAADLWWASPPCQPFSSAGKRLGKGDTRDGYPELLVRLRRQRLAGFPQWLIIENVPGLAQHKRPKHDHHPECPACYFEQILGELRSMFEHVEHRILDAADYGVPQHRKRLITVCGPRPFQWPEPTHGPGRTLPYVTAGEALGIRVFGGGTNPHGPGREHERTVRELTDEPATTVPGEAGNNSLLAIEHGGTRGAKGYLVRSVDEPAPTVGAAGDIRLARLAALEESRKGLLARPGRFACQLPYGDEILLSVGGPNARDGRGPSVSALAEPSPTVRTHADIYIVAAGLQADGHAAQGRPRSLDQPAPTASGKGTMQLVRPVGQDTYVRVRTLTVEERAKLQCLPYVKGLTGKMVGNAVPPPLAEALGRALLRS